MEFTPTQLAIINAIMPFKYKIEVYSKPEPKAPKPLPRKPESESLPPKASTQPRVPEKRVQSESIKSSEAPFSKARNPEPNKKLSKILTDLKSHPKISFFWDFVTKNIFPEFNDRVSSPMDLSMVESRLLSGSYTTISNFAQDVRHIWNTSFSFFAGNLEAYSSLAELSSKFEELWQAEDSATTEKKPDPAPIPDRIPKLVQVTKAEVGKILDKPLGYFEKKQLCDNIKKLEPKYLKGVLEIVKECTDMKGEELEFDIDKLPPRVCRELDKYVKECVGVKGKKSEETKKEVKVTKAEPVPEPVVQGKNEVYLPEESESESSSTSESEEEVPNSGFFAGEDFEFINDYGR